MPSQSPSVNILDILVDDKLATSRSDARRLISQGGVKVNGKKVDSLNLTIDSEAIISVGNRKFIKKTP